MSRSEAGDGVRRIRARVDPHLEAVLDGLAPVVYSDPIGLAGDDVPPYLRGASAVRRSGDRLVIIQDDVNVLAFLRDGKGVEAVLLPAGAAGRRSFDESRGNKDAKMDLEACAALPDGRLVAFGSGSTPRRERLVVLEREAPPRIVEAGALYGLLRSVPAFAGSELNVEGATVLGDALVLFQRGNGAPVGGRRPVDATGELSVPRFVRWLDGADRLPPLRNVVQYDLGSVDGVPYTFTDAAALADGRIAFLACAEASPNSYRDGRVLGCRVGFIARGEATVLDIRLPGGQPAVLKLEGIDARPDQAGLFDVVADRDDPAEAALRGVLTVRGKTPQLGLGRGRPPPT